jgi:hypothetical protein
MVDTRDIPWSGTDARGRRSTRRRAGTHRALLVLDVGARLDQPPHLGGVAVTRRLEQRRERHREAHLRRRSALVLVQERARNCHGSLFSALRTLLRTATAAPLRSSSSAARCPRGCCAAPRRGALPPRGKHREASPRQKSKVRGRLEKGSKVTGVTEETATEKSGVSSCAGGYLRVRPGRAGEGGFIRTRRDREDVRRAPRAPRFRADSLSPLHAPPPWPAGPPGCSDGGGSLAPAAAPTRTQPLGPRRWRPCGARSTPAPRGARSTY